MKKERDWSRFHALLGVWGKYNWKEPNAIVHYLYFKKVHLSNFIALIESSFLKKSKLNVSFK